MSATPQASEAPQAPAGLRVRYGGAVHPAEELARGAAYELFSVDPAAGFERDRRPDARYPYHRFAHASEVGVLSDPTGAGAGRGERTTGTAEPDSPLIAPLSREWGWSDIHGLSQTPSAAADPVLHAVRDSATIRRGTQMIKAPRSARSATNAVSTNRGRQPARPPRTNSSTSPTRCDFPPPRKPFPW